MLYTLFLLCSLVATTAMAYHFTLWDRVYEWGLLCLLFVGFFVGFVLLYLLFAAFFSLFISKKKAVHRRNRFFCAVTVHTLRFFLRMIGVRYQIKGAEKIPADQRFLLVCNHRTFLDPILCMVAFSEFELAFVSKKENLSLPMVGRYMHAFGTLSMDRDSVRGAARAANEAAEVIKNGYYNVGIYPEGRRNRTDQPLLRFHEGTFSIARRAQAPIVVAVARGADSFSKNYRKFRTTPVEIEILDVLDAQTVTEQRPGVLCRMAYDTMWEALATAEQKEARREKEEQEAQTKEE